MPSSLGTIEHFSLVARMQPVWATQMQDTSRPQDSIKLCNHFIVASDMLERFITNNFIERPRFIRKIVKVSLLKTQPRGIGSFMFDKVRVSLFDLAWFKVQSNDVGSRPIGKP
jgi:hypothetical protein